MSSPITGSSPNINALMNIGGFDVSALSNLPSGLPAELSQAFGRIVTDTGKSSVQQSGPQMPAGFQLSDMTALNATFDTSGLAPELQLTQSTMSAGVWAQADAALLTAADATAPEEPARMSEEEIQAHCSELMPSKKSKTKDSLKNIEKEINNPATPPEMKQALVQLRDAIQGKKPALTDSQMGALAILQRHGDVFPIKDKDLQKKIDDPKTLPDLRQALMQLRDDPALHLMLDTGRKGGGAGKADGNISAKDMLALSESPAMKTFNAKKADTYTHNYIPSDADPSVEEGRDITENDAMRELYLYSDNLPKKVSKDTLQKIVDGDAGMKKCPPQVIAAAKFMLDHPDSWSKVTTADGSAKRATLLDNIGKNVYLDSSEASALKTIDENRGVFLKGAITRKGLQKLIDDPNVTDANKQAAQKLLDDPLLYGMLDNAKGGHSSNATRTADDGKISADDITAFLFYSTTKGKEPASVPATHPATTPEAVSAINDMAAGEADDPALKKKKGGGVSDFFHKLGDFVLKAGAMLLHIVAIGLSFLDKIPIIGELAIGLSMAAEGAAGGLDVARTALNGGDVKHALKMVGLGVAGTAISAVALPGMGAALLKGGEKIAEKATVKAAEAGIAKGATKAATEAAEKAAEKGAAALATKTAEEGGEQVAKRSTAAAVKEEAKDMAIDTAADQATNAMLYSKKPAQRQQQPLPGDAGALMSEAQALQEMEQIKQFIGQA
ncbi:MAG: hypothetical protein H7234_05155 [Herminiimonas sp.]|nr:hypothetical protein [Herminiimonas sp.]